jgi:hypothetical protein
MIEIAMSDGSKHVFGKNLSYQDAVKTYNDGLNFYFTLEDGKKWVLFRSHVVYIREL